MEWQPISKVRRDEVPILARGVGIYHNVPFVAQWKPSNIYPEQPWVNVIERRRFYDGILEKWMDIPGDTHAADVVEG